MECHAYQQLVVGIEHKMRCVLQVYALRIFCLLDFGKVFPIVKLSTQHTNIIRIPAIDELV